MLAASSSTLPTCPHPAHLLHGEGEGKGGEGCGLIFEWERETHVAVGGGGEAGEAGGGGEGGRDANDVGVDVGNEMVDKPVTCTLKTKRHNE